MIIYKNDGLWKRFVKMVIYKKIMIYKNDGL